MTTNFNKTQINEQLKSTSGRITSFTLENFFNQFWLNIVYSAVLVILFFLFRYYRRDNENFDAKIREKSKGLSQKFKPTVYNRNQSFQEDQTIKQETDQSENDDDISKQFGKQFKNKNCLGVLFLMKDDVVIRLMGKDLALYLKYLRYQMYMFFVIFVLSFLLMVPLYWSGNDPNIQNNSQANTTTNITQIQDKTANTTQIFIQNLTVNSSYGITQRDEGYNLTMFTVLNIQKDTTKLSYSWWFVVLTTFIVYLFIFKFWRDTADWQFKNLEKGKDYQLNRLKDHVYLIRGIPKNIDPETGSEHVYRILHQYFKDELVDFQIVGNYNSKYAKGTQWQSYQKQLILEKHKLKLLTKLEDFEQQFQQKLQQNSEISKWWDYRNLKNYLRDKSLHFSCLDCIFRDGKHNETDYSNCADCMELQEARKYRRQFFFSYKHYTSFDAALACQKLQFKIFKQEHEIQCLVDNEFSLDQNMGCGFLTLNSNDFIEQEILENQNRCKKFLMSISCFSRLLNTSCFQKFEWSKHWLESSKQSKWEEIVNNSQATYFENQKFRFKNWRIRKAYHQNDILWPQLNYDRTDGKIKNIFWNIFVFLLSIFIFTPVFLYKSVIDPLSKSLDSLDTQFGKNVGKNLSQSAAPILLGVINAFLIPQIVYGAACLQNNETKSELNLKFYNMNLIFMGLNMIALPLTGLVEISELINYFVKTGLNPVDLSERIGTTAAYFTNYVMQVSLLSNGMFLIDFVHFFYIVFQQLKHLFFSGPLIDDFPFDIGYNKSFSCTIGLISLIFAVPMPIMSMFGALFFFFKYFIDKYNIIYVYQQDFESDCRMRNDLIVYLIWGVIIFQLLNFAFLYNFQGNFNYFGFGYAFIVFQILFIYVFKWVDERRPQAFKPQTFKDQVQQKKLNDISTDENNSTELVEAVLFSYKHPWLQIFDQVCKGFNKDEDFLQIVDKIKSGQNKGLKLIHYKQQSKQVEELQQITNKIFKLKFQQANTINSSHSLNNDSDNESENKNQVSKSLAESNEILNQIIKRNPKRQLLVQNFVINVENLDQDEVGQQPKLLQNNSVEIERSESIIIQQEPKPDRKLFQEALEFNKLKKRYQTFQEKKKSVENSPTLLIQQTEVTQGNESVECDNQLVGNPDQTNENNLTQFKKNKTSQNTRLENLNSNITSKTIMHQNTLKVNMPKSFGQDDHYKINVENSDEDIGQIQKSSSSQYLTSESQEDKVESSVVLQNDKVDQGPRMLARMPTIGPYHKMNTQFLISVLQESNKNLYEKLDSVMEISSMTEELSLVEERQAGEPVQDEDCCSVASLEAPLNLIKPATHIFRRQTVVFDQAKRKEVIELATVQEAMVQNNFQSGGANTEPNLQN